MNNAIGVLISGRGSNLQAIIDAIREGRLDASIAIVISNIDGAAGLQRAQAAGLKTTVMPHKQWPSREDYDRALVQKLQDAHVSVVCLAGFMRLLSATFVDAFPNRILNVHPSLLPAFPGVDAQRQAWHHGVKLSGATVHLVTAELDAGPIILQSAVPVLPSDSPESLSERILSEEHKLYPEAIGQILRGGWHVEGRRFIAEPK